MIEYNHTYDRGQLWFFNEIDADGTHWDVFIDSGSVMSRYPKEHGPMTKEEYEAIPFWAHMSPSIDGFISLCSLHQADVHSHLLRSQLWR